MISNVTLCAMNAHYRFYELEVFFKKVSEMGIRYVELWSGPMHYYVDYQSYDDVEILKQLQIKYDIKIIGICPEQTNPKPNNIASKFHLDHVYQYYANMIDIAKQLDCDHVLVCSGWAYYSEPKQEAWNRSIKMMNAICAYAKLHGVRIVIEALQENESILVNSVSDLRRYKNEVNYDDLKICIDFGAMARVGDTIDDYFNEFNQDITHIHFVDGMPCGHLAWGDGKRDMREDLKRLEFYGYHGYLSLETANQRYFEEPWIAEATTIESFHKIEGGEK